MTSFKKVIQRESCFQPGSTLCSGCMESIAFQNVGKVMDNGKKTVFTMGTFCGEVSTLMYPNVVAWGRGNKAPDSYTKSFSIIHNVFESAPTVAEAVHDVSDLMTAAGALEEPVQVVSNCGDGGAIAIGLRSVLHTINRKAPITLVVLVNEFFANTGFQYSQASWMGAETSTTPVGHDNVGNPFLPMDYLHLCVAAGAGLVAQVSPAFPKYFIKVMEKALACEETSVIFVPSPCITGWKYKDGMTTELARLGAETGFFPCFLKEKGKTGDVKFIEQDIKVRPPIENFMGHQQRFQHLVMKDKATRTFVARPEAKATVEQIRTAVQSYIDRLFKIASLDI